MAGKSDGRWRAVNVPVPDGTAAQVRAFLSATAAKLNKPPEVKVVTAADYQNLPANSIGPTDPTKAAVAADDLAATGSRTRHLYMCHNK